MFNVKHFFLSLAIVLSSLGVAHADGFSGDWENAEYIIWPMMEHQGFTAVIGSTGSGENFYLAISTDDPNEKNYSVITSSDLATSGINEQIMFMIGATALSPQATSWSKLSEGFIEVYVSTDTIPPAAGPTTAALTGTEFLVTYKEPIIDPEGVFIHDLKSTGIFYELGGKETLVLEIPATSPNGGGFVFRKIVVPVGEDADELVQIYWRAFDFAGNFSENSVPTVKKIDHLAPLPPDL